MKKILPLLLLTITLLSVTLPQKSIIAQSAPLHNIQTAAKKQTDKIVYTTTQNNNYHRSRCRHKSFKNSIKLSDAKKRNYTPCTKCRP